MTKEEFVKKVSALRAQKLQYEKEYIESNKKYLDGMKLRVTQKGKERIGIVKYNIIEYDEVVPYVNMITKDGDESTRRIRIYPGDIIEVIE